MTAALSAEQRASLERLVQGARRSIEEDLESTLEGKYGINADGRIEPGDSLSLSNAGSAVRADLVEIVEYLLLEGEDAEASVARLVREAAFTHTNRLIAVRVAEAIGLLPETMARGVASTGFRDFAELVPTVAASEWGRFAEFVRLCADELAVDVPALFDPRNPLIALEVSEAVFVEVVEAISAFDDDLWAAPDTFGWAYQFFNTGEERKEMRDASAAPRTSRELAVRNQFFTPSYVVEFLVHNGLGAHLAAGFPSLADELPMLVEVPTEQIDVDLEAVSVLDPAVGSGHFLLGAYDVLEKAWQHAGVEPADAAPAIVRSLWGIDIDPRATQIAQAAVMFRARRHCRDEKLPAANVICARALPAGPEVDALIASLPEHVGRAVQGIADGLVDAPVLGPLLKIEERLSLEVRDVFGTGVIEGTLSEAASNEVDNIEVAVLDALTDIADSTTSSAAERLFAAEARDAVRFVEAMSRRYTAVLMNPPFGEPVPETKLYLKAAYPAASSSLDLLSVFVARGVELSQVETGSCGAITSRTGMFLKSYEKWRQEILLGHHLTALVDLGYGVMEQALVEAAAYVIANRHPAGTGTFIRLLKEANRPVALVDAVRAQRNGRRDHRVFDVELEELSGVPGSPVSYWMSPSIRKLFVDQRNLEEMDCLARVGLQPGDTFRFVRMAWEVHPSAVGTSPEETHAGKRWVPFAKGGDYSPYWADIHLVVDWESDGRRTREHPSSSVRSTQYFFLGGATWTRRTASAYGMRLLPRGVAFSDQGPALICESPTLVCAWMNSRLARALVEASVAAGDEVTSGGAARTYEVGLLQRLPWIVMSGCGEAAERMVVRRSRSDSTDERTHRFVACVWPALDDLDELLEQLDDGGRVDAFVNEVARLNREGLDYLDEEVGPFPMSYSESGDRDDRIEDLYVRPIHDVIDELIEERGGSRAIANLTFVADRRVEVIAHGLEVNPKSVVRVVRERGLVVPEELAEQANCLLSYLVGVAFGRWDVRIGRDPSIAEVPSDLLSPPARYSPGMLLGANGVPPVVAPDGYPIGLPPDGVLVDEPGHSWDVEQRVRDSAVALFGSEESMGDALAELMKRPFLEGYLRSQFFKDHLARYSKSRRKAPIYWQLQVPSKTWGVWLYAPRLSREMLFAVVRETEQRQRLAEQQIGHLHREAETGGGGRKASEVAKELEAEQRLAVELNSFRAEAERIANLGWEPDLDDGMVLNAAPLADLFPAWKEAAKYRKELRAGKYEWATVAQFADQI